MSAAAKKKAQPVLAVLPKDYQVVDEAAWHSSRIYQSYTSTVGYSVGLGPLSDAALAEIGLRRTSRATADAAPETDAANDHHIVVDGFVVDTETGEVLRPVVEDGFAVDSSDRLDWVLRRMGELEAAMVAVEQTDAVIHARAVLANAEQLKADFKRRLDSLHWRFDSEVEHYARQQLAGEKGRTLKSLYGSVSFRSVPSRISIGDADLASIALSARYPRALSVTFDLDGFGDGVGADVQRQMVLDIVSEAIGGVKVAPRISLVPGAIQAELASEASSGFVTSEARETMTITTGVRP